MKTVIPHPDTLNETDVVDPVAQPNRDPITGTKGAHPVGVGVGAATAGVVGGVIGSAVPVVGTAAGVVVGTTVGAILGGFAGKGAAESLFPTDEESYWRVQHVDRPYFDADRGFSFDKDYLAAYRFGYINSYAYGTQSFEEVEPQLQSAWAESKDGSRLNWSEARAAAMDAWTRARVNQAAADRVNDRPL